MTLQAARRLFPVLAGIPALSGATTATGRYRILRELGRGGMGLVYEARDTRLERTVAVKVLPAAWARDIQARARFLAEARAVAALDHPNICAIYTIDTAADGRPFIIMPRYEGETLRQRLRAAGRARRLRISEIVAIATQIAGALEAAHASGIMHGDVKPGNVFLCRTGVVKLLDFGLARRICVEDRMTALSRTGGESDSIFGTASYMAPEQILGLEPDRRSDLFALGVVVYEMLTGALPFAGASPAETIVNVLDDRPFRPIEPSCAAGARLAAIIHRALEKEPDGRFQSAAELRRALRAVRGAQHVSAAE
jgi:serine/threonine protein kinase